MASGAPLQAGVTLVSDRPLEATRLALSAGIRRGRDDPRSGHRYLADALIPAPPWRGPSSREMTFLTEGDALDGAWIGLVRLRPDIWEAFHDLRTLLRRTDDIEAARRIIQAPRWTDLADRVAAWLAPTMNDGGRSLAGTGLGLHPPGLGTVTYDRPRDGYIGLHLDSWYGANGPAERAAAPGRISLNLGDEDRHFVYSNQPFGAMIERLAGLAQPVDPGAGAGQLSRQFLRSQPTLPIVRLRVRPGEAYIAPTENLCHDGATDGQSGWDLSLTIRGRFDSDAISDFRSRMAAYRPLPAQASFRP